MSESFTVILTSVTGGARLDGGVQQRSVIIQDSDIAHGAVQWRHGVTVINSVSPGFLYLTSSNLLFLSDQFDFSNYRHTIYMLY